MMVIIVYPIQALQELQFVLLQSHTHQLRICVLLSAMTHDLKQWTHFVIVGLLFISVGYQI